MATSASGPHQFPPTSIRQGDAPVEPGYVVRPNFLSSSR